MKRDRASGMRHEAYGHGFILLPVALALSLTASIAYLSNRDSGSNVAMVSGRSDAEKARYAAEAGLEHANYVVQQSNCDPTGYPSPGRPAKSENFGGAGYSAHATVMSGNQVELRSTGSYNGASATLIRRNVTVYAPTVHSQTLQWRSGDTESRDTYLSKQHDTQNYGALTRLQVRAHSNHVSETIIRFSIGLAPHTRLVDTYPSGSLVPGAQLSLYQVAHATNTSGATARIEVTPFLVQTDWTNLGVTWNTSDGSTVWPAGERVNRPAVAASLDSDMGEQWKNWNMTDVVQAWISNRRPNYGVWLVASGGNKELEYVSHDESSTIAQRPKLTVNYLAACP